VSLGPFLFLQPWALLGLIALPLLWLLLRATPPEPKRFALPSLALLDDLKPEEETPARTPWWLLLLRMIALALAILGFARPTWAPNAQVDTVGGTLIVVDDGWTSAERWRDIARRGEHHMHGPAILRGFVNCRRGRAHGHGGS
jgi:Aerotolerance regulator N-terminal